MTESKIDFSVVIPAYNEEKTLPQCIKAIKNLAGGFNTGIIVVDNNSTDKTRLVAESFGVKVVDESRQGVGAARRRGTEEAQGEFVVHVDADTYLPPEYLIEAKKRFDKKPKLVCLSGQFYFYDGSWYLNLLRPVLFFLFWLFGVTMSRGKLGPIGGDMVFRKKDYDRTSGFDPRLKFGEDGDISRKFSAFGKVELDMSLHCYISSRRFGFNRKSWINLLNFIWFCIFNRPYINGHELKD
ncbi:MAG: family 2 glycosyl transferase [Candidatus Magasanikbacteria bacterium GW2011_GWA2_37_8]|uniref:Family 2 glycosyl transferase n=1 Tax=Candidatus Magasanikbacteria bacterium GW2011_GWA2_37_8 TaxID=1619036 RepID=A0A0G0HAS5_9BACT|nr:MAG: family 2 glycosyl transferase [Candidatus Magasanikbacteria bacterium GW2011_GWA2_37_8]